MIEPVSLSIEKDATESTLSRDIDKSNDNGTQRCSFYQIRKKFEEKTKSSFPYQTLTAADSKSISDFQKLYPLFKCYYTKRQFLAMENAFDLADRNHDGFLEPKEVKTLLVDHQYPINLCDADFIVGKGDKNKDGKLCPKEFLELCMPAVESLRKEKFKQGNCFLSDEEFIHAVLRSVRNLVNPVERKVKGARLHFENIISGGTTAGNVCTTSPKQTVVNRYLQTLADK